MPIKTGWWDSSLAFWDFSRSNKHCIQLSTTSTIYISCFVIVVYIRFVWDYFTKSQSKNFPTFPYTLFWAHFIVKKRYHRNKYLGLPILNLYATEYLYKNNSMILIHNINIFCYQNQKGTSNNFILEIFQFLWSLIL